MIKIASISFYFPRTRFRRKPPRREKKCGLATSARERSQSSRRENILIGTWRDDYNRYTTPRSHARDSQGLRLAVRKKCAGDSEI